MNDAIIEWGTDADDAAYVAQILSDIQSAGSAAKVAYSYTEGLAEFTAALRGAATMLGLAFGANLDIVEVLVPVLRASSEREQAQNAALVRAGKPGEASIFSGRRGYLDAAWSSIVEATAALDTLKAWEAKRAA